MDWNAWWYIERIALVVYDDWEHENKKVFFSKKKGRAAYSVWVLLRTKFAQCTSPKCFLETSKITHSYKIDLETLASNLSEWARQLCGRLVAYCLLLLLWLGLFVTFSKIKMVDFFMYLYISLLSPLKKVISSNTHLVVVAVILV